MTLQANAYVLKTGMGFVQMSVLLHIWSAWCEWRLDIIQPVSLEGAELEECHLESQGLLQKLQHQPFSMKETPVFCTTCNHFLLVLLNDIYHAAIALSR